MSCFSLFVEEASQTRVAIVFRVSGLQNEFTTGYYSEILLTTDSDANGRSSTVNNKRRMSLRCGFEPGQYDGTYTMWTYDSSIDVNNNEWDAREYYAGFEKNETVTLYAYAKTKDRLWWQIGEPIEFRVVQPQMWVEYDGEKTWLCLKPGYLSVSDKNFSMIGYAVDGGTAMGYEPGSAVFNTSKMVVKSCENGVKYRFDAFLYTNDGESWSEENTNEYGEHHLTRRGYRWYAGSCKYIRGLPKIANVIVRSVSTGLKIDWAIFNGADSYKVRLYNADINDDLYLEEAAETSDNAIYLHATPCTNYKISVQAYDKDGKIISSETHSDREYITPPPIPVIYGVPIFKDVTTNKRVVLKEIYLNFSDYVGAEKNLKLWLKINDDRGTTIWESETGLDLSNSSIAVIKAGITPNEGKYEVLARTEYISKEGKEIYCKDVEGNDYLEKISLVLPQETPNRWDWMCRNGEADFETILRAHGAVRSKKPIVDFDYRVWNDMVLNCKEWLDYYKRLSEGNTIALLEQAMMKPEDKVLYAYKFNNLRMCIDKLCNTGIGEKLPLDVVRGVDFLALGYFLAHA